MKKANILMLMLKHVIIIVTFFRHDGVVQAKMNLIFLYPLLMPNLLQVHLLTAFYRFILVFFFLVFWWHCHWAQDLVHAIQIPYHLASHLALDLFSLHFWTGSPHGAQAGLGLAVALQVSLSLPSSCLCPSVLGITGVIHCTLGFWLENKTHVEGNPNLWVKVPHTWQSQQLGVWGRGIISLGPAWPCIVRACISKAKWKPQGICEL